MALEAHIQRLGLQDSVLLPGFFANPYAHIARAAVLALSSDWEGLPTVLIEGLALVEPVVATDCESGPREILRNGELGELVPVGDISSLARGISKALERPKVALPPEALQRFTLSTALDRFEGLFATGV